MPDPIIKKQPIIQFTAYESDCGSAIVADTIGACTCDKCIILKLESLRAIASTAILMAQEIADQNNIPANILNGMLSAKLNHESVDPSLLEK